MSSVDDIAASKDSLRLLSLPDGVLRNIFYMLEDKSDREQAFLAFSLSPSD